MLQLMTFDASKGCAVPMDLTGAHFEYSIYKPGYSVDIAVNAPSLDEPIRCSIDLTEEQSFAVAALKTDAERTAYVNAVIKERHDEINKAIATTLEARAKATSEGEN